MKTRISQAQVGERLRLLRLAKGYEEQKEWATRIGVSLSRYNNWECGRQIITLENASRIAELTGSSLDYIYLGDESALSRNLLGLIETHSKKS